MAPLTLNQLTKIYGSGKSGNRAVDSVDMAIQDGEIIGLLGSSGCGKTSTLRMIAGFEDVTSGEIRLGERVINQLKPAKRNVAMAFEGYALYPPLTVRDNIGFALLRDKQPRAEVKRQVDEIAELLEITAVLERYPPTISAGQQQRTSLARALVRQADAFLLDEPMSQLEPQLRAVLRARIKDWLIARKMTTVFVTHDQTEAIALADRIAVMEQGVLQQFATPGDLKERPENLFVASFIGEPPMNIYEAHLRHNGSEVALSVLDDVGRAVFEVPCGGIELPLGQRVHVGIRPHRAVVAEGPGSLKGIVQTYHWLGDQTHIVVDIHGQSMVLVGDAALHAKLGDEVPITIPPHAIHLFDVQSGKALYHGSPARAHAA